MKNFKTSLKYCIIVLNGICSLASKAEIDAIGCGYWVVMRQLKNDRAKFKQ